MGRKPGLPEWTEGPPAASTCFSKRALPPKKEDATLTAKYAAKTFLPAEESLQPPPSLSEYYDEHMSEIPFVKKPREPHPHELDITEQILKPPPKLGGRGGRSKAELEQLEKYKVRALAAFERLVVAKPSESEGQVKRLIKARND